jgi:histidinol phosphatase-like enzyme
MTIFLDIDGTLFEHPGNLQEIYLTQPKDIKLLSGVKEKLTEWDQKGCNIILTTGRKECMRQITELQLTYHGIFYDQLIMNIGNGPRVVINDEKDINSPKMAIGISIPRNKGLKDISI